MDFPKILLNLATENELNWIWPNSLGSRHSIYIVTYQKVAEGNIDLHQVISINLLLPSKIGMNILVWIHPYVSSGQLNRCYNYHQLVAGSRDIYFLYYHFVLLVLVVGSQQQYLLSHPLLPTCTRSGIPSIKRNRSSTLRA